MYYTVVIFIISKWSLQFINVTVSLEDLLVLYHIFYWSVVFGKTSLNEDPLTVVDCAETIERKFSITIVLTCLIHVYFPFIYNTLPKDLK